MSKLLESEGDNSRKQRQANVYMCTLLFSMLKAVTPMYIAIFKTKQYTLFSCLDTLYHDNNLNIAEKGCKLSTLP